MSFLICQIREQKILEMDVEIDKFIEEKGISERSMIHTIILDKEVFKEETEAREYVKNKFFSVEEVVDEGDSFRIRIMNSSQIDLDTELEIELRRGVKVLAGDLLPMTLEEVRFNDKGEVNLSAKMDTIDLHEGLPHIIEIARVAEGEHPAYGKLKITQEHLESMERNFNSKVTGVDLAVNEDHKKSEAFGWFKDVFLSFDGQTLYGQVQWNTKGVTALSEKEYRYFSPEFRFNYTHPHTGEEHGTTLLGGALTNYPFLKMEAITELNNKNSQGDDQVDKTTIELSVHNEKVVELSGKISEVQGKLDASEAKNVELSEKVKELEGKIEQSKKESAHNKLFNDGKITKSQLVALNEGKGMLEVLALGADLNEDGKGTSESPSTDINLSEEDKKLAKKLGLSEEEFAAGNTL